MTADASLEQWDASTTLSLSIIIYIKERRDISAATTSPVIHFQFKESSEFKVNFSRMAAKLETCKSRSHLRSTSLPSTTHPLTASVEEQLVRLRSSEATSSSASLICQKLGGLKDLYDRADDWLQLSLTREALSNQNKVKCIEDLLEGSLQILDVSGILREVLLLMKESIRGLESSLRRRSVELTAEINRYLTSRKKMKKLISNTSKSLKKMERQHILNQDSQDEVTLNLLREVHMITLSVFESLMCFLSRPKSRNTHWSFISKVLSSKQVLSEDANEVDHLDLELLVLKSGSESNIQVKDVQKRAEALESSISEIEEVSDSIFRCLVKARVSILNNLNQ
ncbi:hypothetical protein SAY87_004982 [Trapa incisa]|uniref:DUF241 domain protein n=1 Tax=Trapa incisa TaxID=236973 RepID=A0AAN7JPN0_9MYRT|nr:hypothetical protein SAY87_004982 [Trapa incisa]